MNPLDVVNGDDEQFTLLLTRYSEALTTGGDIDLAADPALSAELRQRLQRALGCLRRLRQFPPRLSASDAVTKVMEKDITLNNDLAGKQVGRFRILRTLGHGGGGMVFLAFDPDLRREVALKVPHLAALLAPEMRRRFLREARAAARLDHPNLVPLYEAGESNGVCFLVSAYCRGGSLAEWLKQRTTPVPVRQAAALLAVLADAVQYVHDHGIYHRDIKPSNILLELRPRGAYATLLAADELPFLPRLTDFGLAKQLDSDSGLTANGTVLGTPSYMAPEQLECRPGDIGPHTDVYGLGAGLYELLTGRPPFKGVTDTETLKQVLHEEPARPRRRRSDVPRDLEIICLKCLEKKPARRYASAAELAGDLRRFLAGELIRARPPGRIERLGKWPWRRPASAVLLGTSLLIAMGLFLGWIWFDAMKCAHDADLAATAKQDEQRQEQLRQHEQRLHQYRYADDISLAWRSWEHRRLEDMVHPLDNYRPYSGQDNTDDPRGFEWNFLSRLAHSASRVSRHLASLYCVAFSPDGRTCASGHHDGTIVLWDTTRSGRSRAILKKHKFSVYNLAYSPDGNYLASGSGSRENGNVQGELLLWDTRTGKAIRVFSTPLGAIGSVAFSPDGRTLATAIHLGRGANEVKVWDMPSGTLRHTISFASPRDAASVAFSPGSRTIAVGSSDGKTSLCDSVTGQILETRSGHQGCVWSVACGHKDAVFVSGGHDGRVRLCSLRPGGSLLVEYHHEANAGNDVKVWGVALSPDDRSVASVSRGVLKVWDRKNQCEHFSYTLHGQGRAVAFSPDGKILAVGSEDGRLWMYPLSRLENGRLRIYDVSQSAEMLSWLGHRDGSGPREAWAVAFSPDSKILASAGDDHMIRLWDPASGRERATLRGHHSLVSCIAFSPDGKLLASGSFDLQATVKLWNVATGAEVAILQGHTKPVYTLAFAPNGKSLATAGRDRITRLWDVAARKDQPILSGYGIESMAFSPDGRTLALASQSQALFLWDMAEKKMRRILPPHPSRHVAVAFSPDGKTLATGDSEGTVRFFDAATGEWRFGVRRHTNAVNCLAFSPDGKTLASAGFDKKVKLWQTTTGRELLTLPEQKDRVRWLAFSPDGTMLATAGHDGILKIYRAGSDEEGQPSK